MGLLDSFRGIFAGLAEGQNRRSDPAASDTGGAYAAGHHHVGDSWTPTAAAMRPVAVAVAVTDLGGPPWG